MLEGDVGIIPCWVRASATAQWCQLQPYSEPEFQKTIKVAEMASIVIGNGQ